MSISDIIQSKLKQKLATSPSIEELRNFLTTILHDQTPTEAFHQTKLSQIKEPTLFFTRLMVQDMRQACFTYPFVIEKPFNENSQVYFSKYGHFDEKFDTSLLQDEKYYHEFEDRESVACVPVVGETEWVKDVQKNNLPSGKSIEMVVDKLGLFKLGEIFNAICIYHPEDKILYFVRKATPQETQKWVNIDEYLSKQINAEVTREKLLNLFNQLYDEKYSDFLLYSLISTDHFFISAASNHSNLFKKLLPRVCELKIQAPFKESFFPYKNQEQVMIQTQLQLSQAHTFVILDFSNISNEKQVKIGPQQIDNLKALKVFVEEGNTIYRWLYGQSLLKHEHTGLVVKASSIINPQYVIPEQEKKTQQKGIPVIEESDLREFRCYIHQMRRINPLLVDDRNKIESLISEEKTNKFNEIQLVKVMELSKLNARSLGRAEIKVEDFENSCKLFF